MRARAGWLLAGLIAVGFAFVATVAAQEPAVTGATCVTRYDMSARGITVGHEQMARAKVTRAGKEWVESRENLDFVVNLLVYRYSRKSEEVALTDSSGLCAYHLSMVENGKRKEISGELRDGLFAFTVTENGSNRTWSLPKTEFDCTMQETPEQCVTKPGDTKTLRVLDPGDQAVVKCTYRYVTSEPITVGKRKVDCRVVDSEDGQNKVRTWLTTDTLGGVVLRQDGVNGRGPYSLRPTSHVAEVF